MVFVRTVSGGANYSSPGELYRDLPRRPGAVPGLWAHQSEMLKTFTVHANKPDVALELPTGTGKTLTGLLGVDKAQSSFNRVHARARPYLPGSVPGLFKEQEDARAARRTLRSS